MENRMWLGYGFSGNAGHFYSHYTDTATASDHREGMIRVSGVVWFTNMQVKKRHEEIEFIKKLLKNTLTMTTMMPLRSLKRRIFQKIMMA